ncbi:MAG: hypothetical protein JNK11_09025 [Alphaproteobacteria bacterium]|nr:hypothetical protein [Alphaproteobacteria bacterium]
MDATEPTSCWNRIGMPGTVPEARLLAARFAVAPRSEHSYISMIKRRPEVTMSTASVDIEASSLEPDCGYLIEAGRAVVGRSGPQS